jgi:hypothetical protein
MRRLHWSLALLGAAIAAPAPLAAQAPAGSAYDEYEEYGVAVGEFYGTRVERAPRWIDPDELPVIYLLAREARVSPNVIIALRERGWSWIDITYELGVDPYLYVDRLPYSTGYWRRYSSWELRYLTDRHIIDYVNLLFWADYHRRPITQVIVIRERVPTWRNYVRYHAPPRTVARGVYVVRTPSRTTSPRDMPPRYAVPRDDSQRRGVTRDTRDTRSTETRGLPPSRQPTGTPAQGVRRDPAPGSSGPSRPAQDMRRDPAPGDRGTARPAQGVRRDPAPGDRAPSRPAQDMRRDPAPASDRGTARPAQGVRRDPAPASGSARPAQGVRRDPAPASGGGSARPAQGTRPDPAPARGTTARTTSGTGRRGN